jgi:ABC-type microcin C transport system duplicated ATPase subunit YejF
VSVSVEQAAPAAAERDGVLLRVEHVKQHFPIRKGVLNRVAARVHAVDDVTFDLRSGETLGLVGESGCGKTTLSRTIMRLLDPTEGRITFGGRDITRAGRSEMRPLRRDMQMVFQDPFASLNPRKRIAQIVGGPLALHGVSKAEIPSARPTSCSASARARAHQPLPARVLRRPAPAHRHRARLAVEPKLIVLDEPVSALDVSSRRRSSTCSRTCRTSSA